MSNPFALFDLPVQFQVDLDRLSERYLALQKSLHPDNFSASSAQEQRLAMQKSAEINDALQILKNPIQRAEAIIALNTQQTRDLEQKSAKDMAFLMQQLEWRETLESIENAKDEAKLTAFSQSIEQAKKTMLQDLETALNAQQWQQADGFCDKLRFIQKLLAEIERVEEQLFDF